MKVKCDNCKVTIINGVPCHEQGCYSTFTYTKGKKELKKYEVLSLDLWGSDKEGYEVNDVHSTNEYVLIDVNESDKSIVKKLKKLGLVSKFSKLGSFKTSGNDLDFMTLEYGKKEVPVYQLRAI